MTGINYGDYFFPLYVGYIFIYFIDGDTTPPHLREKIGSIHLI